MRFMEWCRSEEGRHLTAWGIQDEHWDYDEAGQTVTTQPYRDAISNGKAKQNDFGIGVWIFAESEDAMQAAYDGMLQKAGQIGIKQLEEWMTEQYKTRLALLN